MSARGPVAALAALAGRGIAGCATKIDGAKGEQLISRTVRAQVGAHVRAVRCPRDLTAKKGATFRCTVTGTDGSTGQVLVTERDDKGAVSVAAPFLHVGEVETLIARRLSERIGSRVTMRCPEIVVVRKGDRFTCRARSGGTRRRVRVTQQDARGRVRYSLIG